MNTKVDLGKWLKLGLNRLVDPRPRPNVASLKEKI